MKKKMKKLSANELKTLTELFPSLQFNNDYDFVYEKQIPNAGILLIEGEMALIKKNKILENIVPGFIMGVYQLLHNEPVKFACKIKKNAKAILFDKSTLKEELKNKNSPLYSILKEESL